MARQGQIITSQMLRTCRFVKLDLTLLIVTVLTTPLQLLSKMPLKEALNPVKGEQFKKVPRDRVPLRDNCHPSSSQKIQMVPEEVEETLELTVTVKPFQ
jgi:hypothetical protein